MLWDLKVSLLLSSPTATPVFSLASSLLSLSLSFSHPSHTHTHTHTHTHRNNSSLPSLSHTPSPPPPCSLPFQLNQSQEERRLGPDAPSLLELCARLAERGTPEAPTERQLHLMARRRSSCFVVRQTNSGDLPPNEIATPACASAPPGQDR